jgi:hypothetical protein
MDSCDESSDDGRLLGLKPKKKAAARRILDDSSGSECETAAVAQPACDADAESPVVQRKPRHRKVVLQSDTESSSSSSSEAEEDSADDSAGDSADDIDGVEALTKELIDLKPFAKVSYGHASTAVLISRLVVHAKCKMTCWLAQICSAMHVTGQRYQ